MNWRKESLITPYAPDRVQPNTTTASSYITWGHLSDFTLKSTSLWSYYSPQGLWSCLRLDSFIPPFMTSSAEIVGRRKLSPPNRKWIVWIKWMANITAWLWLSCIPALICTQYEDCWIMQELITEIDLSLGTSTVSLTPSPSFPMEIICCMGGACKVVTLCHCSLSLLLANHVLYEQIILIHVFRGGEQQMNGNQIITVKWQSSSCLGFCIPLSFLSNNDASWLTFISLAQLRPDRFSLIHNCSTEKRC